MKYGIMFVDDSISVLESLKWIFIDEPYYLLALDSPFDALNMIESLEIAVAVADQSMQEMEVLDFLKNVSIKSPYTMVIIMTGYGGIKQTFDAKYSAYVYRFIEKPLDNNEIKQAVKTAIEKYEKNEGRKRWAVSILPILSSGSMK